MTKPYPNVRERNVLHVLQQAEWTPLPRLAPAGEAIVRNLVRKAWVEQRMSEHGPSCYRITDLGRQAFKTLMPVK